MATRGFTGKRRSDSAAGRVPPGQYVTEDFPVLSAGPTPRTALDRWSFSLLAPDGSELLRRSSRSVSPKRKSAKGRYRLRVPAGSFSRPPTAAETEAIPRG